MITAREADSTATHPGGSDGRRRRQFGLLAGGAAILVVVAIALFGVVHQGDETDDVSSPQLADDREPEDVAETDPAGVIERYRIAYNSGDIAGVMALFADEAVLTGHPFAARSTGLAAIRSVQLRDLSVAAPSDAYQLYNVEVSGDTVTWDHEFTNAEGMHWCAAGNNAVIADGKILNWAFAPDPHRCELGSEAGRRPTRRALPG